MRAAERLHQSCECDCLHIMHNHNGEGIQAFQVSVLQLTQAGHRYGLLSTSSPCIYHRERERALCLAHDEVLCLLDNDIMDVPRESKVHDHQQSCLRASRSLPKQGMLCAARTALCWAAAVHQAQQAQDARLRAACGCRIGCRPSEPAPCVHSPTPQTPPGGNVEGTCGMLARHK